MIIAINDGLIKNQVKQMKPGHYGVTFLPIKQDTYVVDVKFNHEIVPGILFIYFKEIFVFKSN